MDNKESENKIFDLLTQMYKDFTDFRQDTKEKLDTLGNQVTKIELDHGKKLEALFDGYVQNTKLLEEIQDEVSKHEEVILKRIK
jgi:iron-sulfur cluster repair protein YtfE (RIC family)